ncbi:MAG: GMC family oxidoreductase [Gammaproteobacteria bacterium]|nr:GMC family oxidoreductase [Gammaproteobacteria bacterium]
MDQINNEPQAAFNKHKIDAVIIGAGALGSFYAAQLAQQGKTVVVLEAGPAWSTADLYSSQIWARRLKWRGAPVLSEGKNPLSHNLSMGSGLGGAALHHFGTWPRFTEETFELKSRYGESRNWPFSYDTLRPFYDRIQDDVGIAGDHTAEPWRPSSKPYPMPGHKLFRQAQLLQKGFESIGKSVAPLPVIINSTVYKGRPPCMYDGWCEAGCPIGALNNPLVSYLPLAQKHGAIFRSNCTVTRILMNKKIASGVEYIENGERKIQLADVVILASSFIQTPRLLLNSRTAQFPNGLANRSGLVGQELEIDVLAPIYGLFAENTEAHMGVNAGQLMHRSMYKEKDRAHLLGNYQWQIAPSMKPNDLLGVANTRVDLFGRRLHEFMQHASSHIATMAGFGGSPATKTNRISLSEKTDANGLPLARLEHTFSPRALQMYEHLVKEGTSVMRAAGAKEIWNGRPVSGHICGGTIMGKNPRDSVCDSYGRAHDIPNLIISGAGLLPAGSGFSPTFTLHALALRSSEHLLTHWQDYARG